MEREELFQHLKENSNVLSNESLTRAFEKINRADFVGIDYASEAYEDYALPIGFEQTISQPTTVAFMLELLGVKEGDRVLDIGSGSGWTTALLAEIVGESGQVIGVEVIPELVDLGNKNLSLYDYPQASIVQASNEIGYSAEAPYDKILVSASAPFLPEELLGQLKVGGTMVIPVEDAIYQIIKISDDETEDKSYPGFRFVPLVY